MAPKRAAGKRLTKADQAAQRTRDLKAAELKKDKELKASEGKEAKKREALSLKDAADKKALAAAQALVSRLQGKRSAPDDDVSEGDGALGSLGASGRSDTTPFEVLCGAANYEAALAFTAGGTSATVIGGQAQPTDEAVWLVEALCKVLDEEEVTLTAVGSHVCKFSVPGRIVPQVFVVSAVPSYSPEFVHMLEAVVKECEAVHALPRGASAKRAVRVLQLVLMACIEKRAAYGRVSGGGGGSGGGKGDGVEGGEEMEGVTGFLAALQQHGGQRKETFTTEKFNESVMKLKAYGFPVDKSDVPEFKRMAKAGVSLLVRKGGIGKPELPTEHELQPVNQAGRYDMYGNLVERETRQVVVGEAGMVTQEDLVRTIGKGGRTLYVACHGHVLYWMMVQMHSVLIPNLCPSYKVTSTGLFVCPYYLTKFLNLMRRVVGQGKVDVATFDEQMAPLLVEVQDRVNSPEEGEIPWSGDDALKYLCEQLPKNLNLARARVSGSVPREKPSLEKPTPKKNKVAIGKEAVGGRAAQKKCATCAGNASHASGRCFKCRLASGELAARGGGAGGGGAGVGGAANVAAGAGPGGG